MHVYESGSYPEAFTLRLSHKGRSKIIEVGKLFPRKCSHNAFEKYNFDLGIRVSTTMLPSQYNTERSMPYITAINDVMDFTLRKTHIELMYLYIYQVGLL